MPGRDDYLALDEAGLLAQCEVHAHRASGPGGQHRNKVSSAIRLHHRPTGLTASAAESRLQNENRRHAVGRLRMALACRLRQPLDLRAIQPPPVVRECLFRPRGQGPRAPGLRLAVGRKDRRFWQVVAFLLDAMETAEGRLAEPAAVLGISTSNLAAVLRSDRHALAAARIVRKRHGHGPIA